MNLFLSEKARNNAYLMAIMLCSLVVRMVLGVVHPHLSLEQTALVGITTVLLTAPSLYRWFFNESLIKPNKRIQYVILSAASCGLFLYFIALHA